LLQYFLQLGVGSAPEGECVVEMGGHHWRDENHIITESGIRAFYDYYRKIMDVERRVE